MSIKKKYFHEKGVCLVHFRLPKLIQDQTTKAAIAGNFNDWNTEQYLMIKDKDGDFEQFIELPMGKTYQFRYLIDDQKWVIEPGADDFIPAFSNKLYNSVIKL